MWIVCVCSLLFCVYWHRQPKHFIESSAQNAFLMDMVNAFSLVKCCCCTSQRSLFNKCFHLYSHPTQWIRSFVRMDLCSTFVVFLCVSLSSIIKIGIARSVTLLFWFADSDGRVRFFFFRCHWVCLLNALNELFRPDSVDSMKCVNNCSSPKVNETVNRVIRFCMIFRWSCQCLSCSVYSLLFDYYQMQKTDEHQIQFCSLNSLRWEMGNFMKKKKKKNSKCFSEQHNFKSKASVSQQTIVSAAFHRESNNKKNKKRIYMSITIL